MPFPRNAFVAVMLLIVMGLGNSSRAFAQTPSPADQDRLREPIKKGHKIDLLYHASEAYLAVGTGFDMMTTVNNLGHPTTANSTNGAFLIHYYPQEVGWAAIVGSKNTTGVVLANVGLNLGIDLLDRKLYRRGGKWRAVAVSLNVLKGTGNMVCGFNNIRTNEGVDKAVRMQTGYKGIVVWSR